MKLLDSLNGGDDGAQRSAASCGTLRAAIPSLPMNENRTSGPPRRSDERQAKLRQGKSRLDEIEDHLSELPEIRRELANLTVLLTRQVQQEPPPCR